MNAAYDELRSRLAEICDLTKVAGLLAWDQRTMMPRRGAASRADQVATVTRLAHELFVSDEIGRLLDELRPYEESLDYGSDEASLIRVVRRDYEKARPVPSDLRAEMSRTSALAMAVWDEARGASDFDRFLPHLKRTFELRRRYVACFDPADEDYDILLDDYEPGMTTAEVRAVFQEMKSELVPLIAEIAERVDAVDDSCLRGHFPVERQKELERAVLERFGFSPDAWRIDETAHPFAANGGPDDIRLTTRHHEDSLKSIFSTMHEFGHGLYEHGVDRALVRTPLCGGVSNGLHESQSRMWENLVGRSRAFWRGFYPLMQQTFPDRLGGVDLETFYRAVNKVEPCLIRIDSDEATYNLHIVLRFELEQELLAGRIAPADLPEAWNARTKEYLGLDVPDVADGVLQDMHWAGGHVGYFPAYSLGNIASVQIWERAREDLTDLDGQLERGEFAPLQEWLREHMYRHGRKFTPKEMLERLVGSSLDPQPYLRYLRRKLGEIYGLS